MEEDWNGVIRSYLDCKTFLDDFGEHYILGAPPVRELEEQLANLLQMPTVVTSRGMTAIASVICTLTTCKSCIACSSAVYPGTRSFLNEMSQQGRMGRIIWFNPAQPDSIWKPESQGIWKLAPEVDVVFTETIGNAPEAPVADISAMLKVCEQRGMILVVDTTFTPFAKMPKSQNLVVVCSMTKYHQADESATGGRISMTNADLLARICGTRQYQNSLMLPETAEHYRKEVGYTGYGYSRLRYESCSSNALELARLCEKHPAIAKVWYAGLETHPQYSIVARDFDGQGGGVFYLQLAGGEEAVIELTDALVIQSQGCWKIAPSFGGKRFRIFPFIGPLKDYLEGKPEGIVRIAAGYRGGSFARREIATSLDELLKK